MKSNSIYIKLFTLAGGLLLAICFSSCKKNNIDPSGQFNLKVVNASPTAGPQSFTLAGTVLVSGGLNYTDASPYITSPSGTRLVGEFKNDGTNNVYASGEIWTANTINQTVYLAGSGSKARVKVFTDDLGAPNNGKVKIKFIHFSDNAPSDIKIRNGAGDEIVDHISRNTDSGYKYVDPGTLSVQIIGFTSKDNLGSFDITDLQAGKIYTLYFTDSANGSLVMNKVLHN
ncbi:MAG: hypothetical protein JWR38_3172 [Mucilaginibacter sp.]|nr:hypothetical protein [Mucilaginibacter sp.]